MTMTGQSVIRQPRPSGLADVLDLILDKGLVIDAYVRVSLVGIELLTVDARIVIASVDTYLRFAEATNRLDLRDADDSQGLPQLMAEITEGGASHKTKGALSGVKDEVSSWFGGDDEDDERERQPARRSSNGDRSNGDERSSRRRESSGDSGGRERKERPRSESLSESRSRSE